MGVRVPLSRTRLISPRAKGVVCSRNRAVHMLSRMRTMCVCVCVLFGGSTGRGLGLNKGCASWLIAFARSYVWPLIMGGAAQVDGVHDTGCVNHQLDMIRGPSLFWTQRWWSNVECSSHSYAGAWRDPIICGAMDSYCGRASRTRIHDPFGIGQQRGPVLSCSSTMYRHRLQRRQAAAFSAAHVRRCHKAWIQRLARTPGPRSRRADYGVSCNVFDGCCVNCYEFIASPMTSPYWAMIRCLFCAA